MQPTTERLHNLENSIERFTFEAGEKIGTLASAITNTTTDYKETTENFVEQHPVKALAMAAGAGLLVGAVLTYLMRKD